MTKNEAMNITLTHDGGGLVKITPAVEGHVWYDTYFNGVSLFHSTVKTEMIDDVMMALMDSGYYLAG